MSEVKWVSGLLMASVLLFGGCGKPQQQEQGPPPMTINGVKVDLPKLQTVMTDKPELRASVGNVTMAIRYRKYEDGLAELNKLAADSSLSEPQKKVVSDVIEQIKQVIAKAPANPAP